MPFITSSAAVKDGILMQKFSGKLNTSDDNIHNKGSLCRIYKITTEEFLTDVHLIKVICKYWLYSPIQPFCPLALVVDGGNITF